MTGLMESYKIDTMNFSSTALREDTLDFMVKTEKILKAMKKMIFPKRALQKVKSIVYLSLC